MDGIQKYIPLKTIVSYALDEMGKSIKDFDKVWVIGFRAYVDLGYTLDFEPISVRLPLLGNKTAILPADYVTWTKIGVMGTNGKVSTLKINNNISTFRDNNPNRIESLQADVNTDLFSTIVGSPYFLNYFSNGVYAPLFGLPNGLLQAGECTIDETNRLIVFSPIFSFPDVVLEYLSSPEQNSDYQVDIFLQESIIAFCKWKLKMGTEQEYINRKREARRLINPVRLQVINQVIRENRGYKIYA
jgi:hypothetical protein